MGHNVMEKVVESICFNSNCRQNKFNKVDTCYYLQMKI